MDRRIFVRNGLLAVAGLGLAGCYHYEGPYARRGHGPPPHAPAHGYRHKHRVSGVDLVFDSGLGVYVVVGVPYHYYYRDRFYRFRDGRWYFATRYGGPWHVAEGRSVPPGLRKKARGWKGGKGRKNGGRGRGRY